MVKTCQKCGGIFSALSNSQKYCSVECLEHGSREYYRRKFQSFDRRCIWCGFKFLGTRAVKWCSDTCKRDYQHKENKRRQKERIERLKNAFDGVCKHCGSSFKGTKVQQYCSEKCRCEAMQKFNREKAVQLFQEGKNIREIVRELNAATTVRRALK